DIGAKLPGVVQIGFYHDDPPPFPQLDATFYPNPSFPSTARDRGVLRILPDFKRGNVLPGTVIGSFGFGFATKGFPRIVEAVNAEFEEATIRLHLPGN